jgi:hypothetical protein
MALQQFLSAIRAARGALFGRINESADVGRRADQAGLKDAMLRTADVWLTHDLVKEYDEADFRFLPSDEQAELRSAVETFRRLTAGLQGESPSPTQIAQGYDLFAKINNITAPHFGEEPDLQRIADATRSVHWPDYVLWVEARIGTDSAGDPAVWVWLVVKDDVEIESPKVQAELARVREAYRNAIQKAGIDRWPYITVRTRSETKALVGGAA